MPNAAIFPPHLSAKRDISVSMTCGSINDIEKGSASLLGITYGSLSIRSWVRRCFLTDSTSLIDTWVPVLSMSLSWIFFIHPWAMESIPDWSEKRIVFLSLGIRTHTRTLVSCWLKISTKISCVSICHQSGVESEESIRISGIIETLTGVASIHHGSAREASVSEWRRNTIPSLSHWVMISFSSRISATSTRFRSILHRIWSIENWLYSISVALGCPSSEFQSNILPGWLRCRVTRAENSQRSS